MDKKPALILLRRDLRLADNPALQVAFDTGKPLIILFILDEDEPHTFGGAQRWWLHFSLKSLQQDLEKKGGCLILKRGDTRSIVHSYIEEYNCDQVYWNRRYAGHHVEIDKDLKQKLSEKKVDVFSFNGSLLQEPWAIKTKTDGYYRVFTPFWRNLQNVAGLGSGVTNPPKSFKTVVADVKTDTIDDWALLPSNPDWAAGFDEKWSPGEKNAQNALSDFLDGGIGKYKDNRDRPAISGTSRISPYLAFGEISPSLIWQQTMDRIERGLINEDQGNKFLSELAWRDFAYHLLFHNPEMHTKPFRPTFESFPWKKDHKTLLAWQKGQTGIPIIDAGMRELWQTGWMHNRVRMVVASFLTKNLLINWQEGERWFWDCLVDADVASNPVSWQWVAGSGADAAPYFRIFNAVTQGQKFDSDGTYVRRYVPELNSLDSKFVHNPWEAPSMLLQDAGITLGETYPKPLVDLKLTRQRALDAYAEIKNAS